MAGTYSDKIEWYRVSANETFTRLNTSENGLSNKEALQRIELYGPNTFAAAEKINRLRILAHQFTSPLIYILLIAAVVTLLLHEYIDFGVIISVVVLNAVIGFFQEYKAEANVRSLQKMVMPKAKVIRDGAEKEIPSETVVPGDIMVLGSGCKVVADLRLIHINELKIDESLLTGESVPAQKKLKPIEERNLIPGDQCNMAFTGTNVVSGRGKGIVVATGSTTVLGEIADSIREVEILKTPLQSKLENFAHVLGVVILIFSAIVFISGVVHGAGAAEMFMVAVATAVSAIPEGLPVAVTIAMAIGVSRMARRNAIIRKLPAVEALGGTTVIGSDKTGTLTKNEMTVKLIYDGRHTYEVTGIGYEPKGEILHDGLHLDKGNEKRLHRILRAGVLCNESKIFLDDEEHTIDGDPTEGALLVSAMKAGISPELEKENFPQLASIPFESERGYMATLHSYTTNDVIFVKGAPEKVLRMCGKALGAEGLDREDVDSISAGFGREGLRVLAFAFKEVSGEMEFLTHKDVESGLTFLGLQGMMDPPREEVAEAIKGCRQAGIKVVMITGDHADTAKAIANRIGISTEESDVLTGSLLESLRDEELFHLVRQTSVFSRVSPHHKMRITQQLVANGEIVAITGDGVNDAAALKAAHIGIAMGKCGSDIAKEASDMVIVDDNFSSIFAAVEEGRVVYDNILKVTLFLVSCGFGELLAITAALLLGVPIPYIPAQILWLNLVTNGLQDVALAFEPAEKNIIHNPPRKADEKLLSPLMLQRTLLMGVTMAAGTIFMFITSLDSGESLEKSRTIALTTMVFFQFYQAANCRSAKQSIFSMNLFGNPLLTYSIIAAFFAQLAVIYVPAFQWIFRTEPIGIVEWLQIGLVTSTIILAVEIDKLVRRKISDV